MSNAQTLNSFVNRKVALLTKHGKQDLIAPLFFSAFQSELVHTDEFDTDSLGAFDHSTQRSLSPKQAALKKAYLACELTHCEQGIGSEGSISSIFGLGLVDEEFLAFVDVQKQIEVIARVHSGISLGPISANSYSDLKAQLLKYDENQAWMLSMVGSDSSAEPEKWEKGMSISSLLSKFKNTELLDVYLEPDFRAMCCPARQKIITNCTEKLIEQLNSKCPKCNAIDFDTCHAKTKYLSCELCTLPTNQVQEQPKTCSKCGFEQVTDNTKTVGSAFYCSFCNP